MRVFGWISLILIILVLVAWVVVKLNAPGSVFVRKTFEAISGKTLVDTKHWDAVQEENRLLALQRDALHAERDSITEVSDSLIKKNETLASQYVVLQGQYEKAKDDLVEAKAVFDTMTITEQVAAFDDMAEGDEPSVFMTLREREVVAVEPQRISNAVWQLHEAQHIKAVNSALEGMVAAAEQRYDNCMAMVDAAALMLDSCDRGLAIERQMRENAEKAAEDTIKRGRRIARGGVVTAVVALAVSLFN